MMKSSGNISLEYLSIIFTSRTVGSLALIDFALCFMFANIFFRFGALLPFFRRKRLLWTYPRDTQVLGNTGAILIAGADFSSSSSSIVQFWLFLITGNGDIRKSFISIESASLWNEILQHFTTGVYIELQQDCCIPTI